MATEKEIEKLISAIKSMEDQIDEELSEHFAELEMGLDEIGIKENPYVFKIFDRASDYHFKIIKDLKELRKILNRALLGREKLRKI